ncbi:MAG: hypothetical protein M1840_007976 [Geoglossum simile]|nr:MAG: hypothetical protein M1840_007976 [Geoglossum simile]
MAANQQIIERLVDNCLIRRSENEIEQDVRNFYSRYDEYSGGQVVRNKMDPVVPEAVLLRGALVARDPGNNQTAYTVNGMTDAEAAALAAENKAGFGDFTWGLKALIFLRGWTQSSINTGGPGWSDEFGLIDPDNLNLLGRGTLYFGFIQSAPFLIGSVLGLIINDLLQYYADGRRPALAIAGLFSLASFIGSSYSRNTSDLLACRLVLAIGVATKASIAPILAAEASLDGPRGKILIGSWQFCDTIGIFLGFCFHLATFPNWRATTAAPAIPTIIFLILAYLAPDSPQPSIQKGDYIQAFKIFRRLRNTDIQACRDLWRGRAQLQYETEMELRRHGNIPENAPARWPREELYQAERDRTFWFQGMFDLFRLPYSRRACLTAAIPMVAQIFTAVNVIAFYSSTLFKESSGSPDSKKATWLGFGFGISNVIFTIPAFFYVDKKGRRYLLLPSLLGVTISLLGLAFCFYARGSLRTGLVTFFIVVFTFFYSIGCGPIPFTLSAEVFPLATRSRGISFGVFLNFFFLGLLILFVPELTYRFGRKNPDYGRTNLLCFFAGLSAISLFLSFIFVRATARPKLVEMAYIFDKPTLGPSGHVRFQLTEQLPWLANRYLPWRWRQNDDDKPQFVSWSQEREEEMRQAANGPA